MSYQVIARKWRPQKFDDVVGQQAVTRTLRNALATGRLAQAFVFAGPRGVGKTTTARILARALNCQKGPTPDPCGACDACVEIAEGRDIDVLEIDAATHTGIDNVREVIISGLSIRPVRNRYKVFIIDEVHQLSTSSFNALLKSIEEPPPHVVFMMATTELDKIPETVLSRSQVYEFRQISTKAIAHQLRVIVDAESIAVGDDSLQLIARDAEGSMRDGQSKLDQVIAFTGQTITADDVATVLGLVGRDLLLDTIQAVSDEDAPAAFALAARFSREVLLRAFDLLTRAESEIRAAAQPRYNLEKALLRWIHLRKLVSIEDLIAGAASGPAAPVRPGSSRTLPEHPAQKPAAKPTAVAVPSPVVSGSNRITPPSLASGSPSPVGPGTPSSAGSGSNRATPPSLASGSPSPVGSVSPSSVVSGFSRTVAAAPAPEPNLKDALLAEVRKSKPVVYNMVIAQAQAIDVAGDRITFTFSPAQGALREKFEKDRAWLETVAQRIAGRRIAVSCGQAIAAPPAPGGSAQESDRKAAEKKSALREQALADAGVQALLDVFPAEIRDVEEM